MSTQALMSYKPEVIVDNSGEWTGNGLAFETEAEAMEWVTDLSYRWTLVRDVRVVESTEPVNHRMENGRAVSIERSLEK